MSVVFKVVPRIIVAESCRTVLRKCNTKEKKRDEGNDDVSRVFQGDFEFYYSIARVEVHIVATIKFENTIFVAIIYDKEKDRKERLIAIVYKEEKDRKECVYRAHGKENENRSGGCKTSRMSRVQKLFEQSGGKTTCTGN